MQFHHIFQSHITLQELEAINPRRPKALKCLSGVSNDERIAVLESLHNNSSGFEGLSRMKYLHSLFSAHPNSLD